MYIEIKNQGRVVGCLARLIKTPPPLSFPNEKNQDLDDEMTSDKSSNSSLSPSLIIIIKKKY
jgi:hypothetical protein